MDPLSAVELDRQVAADGQLFANRLPPEKRRLRRGEPAVTVRCMYALARLLQVAGLVIPPLAMIAQLGERIRTGQMLQFLVVAVCLFSSGYLLQQYTGPRN